MQCQHEVVFPDVQALCDLTIVFSAAAAMQLCEVVRFPSRRSRRHKASNSLILGLQLQRMISLR